MAFNTYPCNPWPISTEQLNKGNNDDLNTRVSALEGEVSDLSDTKTNQITIAPFFNPEASYEVGDLVYYNGLSYRCTNAHEGEWDADDFAATTIAGELDTLKSGLTNLDNRLPICAKSVYAGDGSFTVTIPDDSSKYYFFVFGIKNLAPFYFGFSVNTEHDTIFTNDNTITGVIADKTTITISGIGNYSNVTVISPREFS